MKSLTIILDESKLKLEASEPLNIYDIINLTCNAVLSVMNNTVNDAPEELKQDIKEHLFDLFNETASVVLAQFAPDIPLRPDITEEAILELELKKAHESKMS